MPERRADALPAPAHSRPRPAPVPPQQPHQRGAIVAAARVGRLLGRSGLRVARQLPGLHAVEHGALRLGRVAVGELSRLLEVPQQVFGTATAEEQRALLLVRDGGSDPEPLRSAMSELLHRSKKLSATSSRDYLFGNLISQLVPDEARILAALADTPAFAALDVEVKKGRSAARTVLANASAVGTPAGITKQQNVATYLTRLHGLGLVEFGPADEELRDQYELLAADRAVLDAKEEAGKGAARLVRKTVRLTPLGRDFWAACTPEHP